MSITDGQTEPVLIDVQIQMIQEDLTEMKQTLAFIKENIVRGADVIEKVGKEVMPTVDALTKSPMLKMLLPKEKK